MKRKSKRQLTTSSTPQPPATLSLESTPVVLQALRDDIAIHRSDIHKSIAELDALADEINATLAYLKAKRDR